jgi:L-Ala-D/L-Glu epimerase
VQLTFYPYSLEFRHPFHIAAGIRNSTDVVYTELFHEGFTGYGEVALPPYLKETIRTVSDFLSSVKIPADYNATDFIKVLDEWNKIPDPNYPALAALDIAFHDLQGKLTGKPIHELYKIRLRELPFTAFTIGISDAEELKVKLNEADKFMFYKLKLGTANDLQAISVFRSLTKKPFCIDANRGWSTLEEAMEISALLQDYHCSFIEQPFEKHMIQLTCELRRNISVPVIFDESVQTIEDINNVKNCCDGINIKLAKCGGIYPAYKMIRKAKRENLKVFLGCMSEGSCSTSAAAHLAPLADWVDLDGPLLIKNDPFKGVEYIDGRIRLNKTPGSGVEIIQ